MASLLHKTCCKSYTKWVEERRLRLEDGLKCLTTGAQWQKQSVASLHQTRVTSHGDRRAYGTHLWQLNYFYLNKTSKVCRIAKLETYFMCVYRRINRDPLWDINTIVQAIVVYTISMFVYARVFPFTDRLNIASTPVRTCVLPSAVIKCFSGNIS